MKRICLLYRATEREQNLSLRKVLLALSWPFYANESPPRRNVDQRIHEEDGIPCRSFLSTRTISLTKCTRVARLISTCYFATSAAQLPVKNLVLLTDGDADLREQL